ncbi:hypothetical protein [Amycolatopsis coloradensis]|nr:hypothetical protein [Amycolatopsis coloradensis]
MAIAAVASLPSLFVRPDGTIVWADAEEASDENARKLLDTAVRRWVGA